MRGKVTFVARRSLGNSVNSSVKKCSLYVAPAGVLLGAILLCVALAVPQYAFAATSHMPSSRIGGMGTIGNGYILGVAVEFPAEGDQTAYTFDDAQDQASKFVAAVDGADSEGNGNGDSNAGKNAISNSSALGTFPYESVNAYYKRSSYGKLNLSCNGTCYVVTAKHCRSYYTNSPQQLVQEVANTLDTEQDVDFSKYDGNNDGIIDALYIVFAGENTGWNTTWWPREDRVDGSITQSFDGKTLCNTVFMETITGENSVRMLIHETGHVLGLDDYYSYSGATNGIATVDMMNDNTGDHNAFSKWLLGWIEDEQITRVAITADGIKVRRGAGNVEEYEGNVQQAINAFTTDDALQGGEFIAVSSDESILYGDLLCSFYLLQYDQAAGNQAFGVGEGDASNSALTEGRTLGEGGAGISSGSSSDGAFQNGATSQGGGLVGGLRVYRIQAQLTADGSSFMKTCANASNRHDMFIEALKPSDGGAAAEIGDAFHTGAQIGVSTTPSTNFREDFLGYTGIHIDVTDASNAQSGTVTFSYEEQPDEQKFAVTPAFSTGILDVGAYSFDLSAQPDWTTSDMEGATLIIDGASYAVRAQNDNNQLLVYYELPSGTISQNSTCELVLPAGFFNLYSSLSQEIRIQLNPRSKTLEFVESGEYYASEYTMDGENEVLSSAVDVEGGSLDGKQVIVAECPIKTQVSSDQPDGIRAFQLRLFLVSEDGKTCNVLPVEGSELERVMISSVQTVALDRGRLFACVQGTDAKMNSFSKGFWIDAATGELLDLRNLDNVQFTDIAALDGEVALLRQSPGYGAQCAITKIFSHDESADKHTSEGRGISTARIIGVGSKYIAGIDDSIGFEESTVKIFDSSAVETLLDGDVAELQPFVQFSVPNCCFVEDISTYDENFYVLTRCCASEEFCLELRVFSNDGTLLRTTKVEGGIVNYATDSKMVVGKNGSVAITTKTATSTTVKTMQMEIAAVTPDGNFAGYSSAGRAGIVYWADESLFVAHNSPDYTLDTGKLAWVKTAALDVTPSDDDGSSDTSPETNSEGDAASTIAKTGDNAQAFMMFAIAIMLATATLLAGAISARKL